LDVTVKGKVVKTTEEEYHLQNLITNDYHAIDKKDALVVAPQCLGKLLLFTSKRACPTCSNSATSPSGPSSTTSESGTPSSQIYTSIGTPILVSVNPYQKLSIFTTKDAAK